jgi:hypothetical protein
VTPTRVRALVGLFVVASVISWAVLHLMESRGSILTPLPWKAPVLIAAVAAVVLAAALSLRSRLRGSPGTRPPHPIGVARMAVLGKASAHAGPVLAGLYGGYALVLLPDFDIAGRRDRALVAVMAVVASLLLTGAGLLLERVCRVRPPQDDVPADSEPVP